VFYTSQDDTILEMLLIDNKCTVPHEVLAEEGIMSIGIRAATTDGTKIKTSSIVKLKIVKCANAADTTISPTMDLYQQYLAAMREHLDPALTEVKALLAEHMNSCDEKILSEASGVVLWENPDTNADFAAQKIDIDLTDYNRIHILFRYEKDTDSYFEAVCTHKNISFTACGMTNCVAGSTLSDDIHARSFVVSDTGVDFSTGKTNGNVNDRPNYCIPCEIIGYKH
jgi:hypothetical protein